MIDGGIPIALAVFQLTTSRRGRHDRVEDAKRQWNFNSLPHAEVDVLVLVMSLYPYISTHYLTQR